MSSRLISSGLIIVLVFALCIYYSKPEKFARRRHLNFLSRDDTAKFLLSDPDNYHKNMSVYDLRAQSAPDPLFVMERAASAAVDFTPDQMKTVMQTIPIIDDYFRNHLDLPFIDGKKIADIPWVLALTRDRIYEQGYPHTREDIIFLPSDLVPSEFMTDFAATLAHEKVHVYSRMYPDEMEMWNIHNGFTPIGHLRDFHRARSNPDIDNVVYLKDDLPTVAIYNSEYPKGIFDAHYAGRDKNDPAYEHPNESLAYKIDKMLQGYLSSNPMGR